MDSHEKARDERNDNTVENIKSEQSLMAHLLRTQNKEPNLIPNKRGVTHDRCPHGNSPKSQLIPREEIPGIAEAKRKNEKADSNDPIELPGGAIGSCVKDSDHVQKDCHDHRMCSPSMKVSQDLAVVHESEGLNVEVGPFDGRSIMKHQENTCYRQTDKEKAGNASQAECVRELKAMAFHLHGKDMKEKIVKHQHGPLQFRVGNAGSKDGSPNRRICNPLKDSFPHFSSGL